MKAANDRQLSLVIPVYNEADNVEPLVAEVHRVLRADGFASFELIYVDDGSTDATPERLAAMCLEFPALRVVRHRANCGQSAAILSGVRAAHYPVVVTLDGDGQNDPRDIARLVEALETGRSANVQLVVGQRSKRQDTWLRRVSSRVANGVRRRLTGDGIHDTGCGLKVFSRETFLQLPFFDHMHRFLPALVLRNGGQVLSLTVSHRSRTRGTSKYGVGNRLWVGIVDLLGVMWLQRRAARPNIQYGD